MKTNIQHIEKHLLEYQGHQVLLDRDVAALYGVETKRINEAVKNNVEKFPSDYLIVLTKSEWSNLRSKISTTNFSKTRVQIEGRTGEAITNYDTSEAPAEVRRLAKQ